MTIYNDERPTNPTAEAWAEHVAELRAEEARGEWLSERGRDELANEAADQYERALEAMWP